MSVVSSLNHHLGKTIFNHTQMLKHSVLLYSLAPHTKRESEGGRR